MTRFARAKGSKASNERVFSEATPWSEMKNQMLNRQQEIEEEKKRREAEAKRNENYQKFLKEREEKTTSMTEWAEFPEDNETKQNGLSDKSKTIKKQKNKLIDKKLKKKVALALETETIRDKTNSDKGLNGIQKTKNSDTNEGNADEKVEKPKKKKLKIILNNEATDPNMDDKKTELKPKQKIIKKGKTSFQQNEVETGLIVKETNIFSENHDVDDTPTETSSKVEVSEPVIKKTKTKKKKTKIPGRALNEDKKNDGKNEKKAEKPKRKEIDFDSLSEGEKKKILKKQEKRKKQFEKKKLKKQQNREKSEKNETGNSNLDTIEKKPKSSDKKKISKSTEKFIKPKPSNNQKEPEREKMPPKKQRLENGTFKRRKDFQPNKIMVNGNEIELEYFDGFQIKKEDAKNLIKLKKEMIAKGLPRSEINRTLKLERRKAEKDLTREKKKVCFNCRKFGHNLSECPLLSSKDELIETSGTGICFKCGSTEHTAYVCRVVDGQNFKFASCFICKEQGHISRQCPDNARGLYPKGGSCRVCGDVTHLKRDCPQFQEQQRKEEDKYRVGSILDGNPEDMEPTKDFPKSKARSKIIKF